MITDDVWGRLDQRAGMATRRELRWLRAAFLTVAAVALLGLGASVSGLAVPGLRLDRIDPEHAVFNDEAGRIRHMSVRLNHTVVNDGWFPATVTGVGLRADGVRLTGVQGPAFPVTIGAGERVQMALDLEVIDCDRAAATLPEQVIRVERWWGSQSTAPTGPDGPISESYWEFVLGTLCDR